jgi:hypothetical protein
VQLLRWYLNVSKLQKHAKIHYRFESSKRHIYNNVVSHRSMRVIFKKIDFVIRKELVAQIIAHLLFMCNYFEYIDIKDKDKYIAKNLFIEYVFHKLVCFSNVSFVRQFSPSNY